MNDEQKKVVYEAQERQLRGCCRQLAMMQFVAFSMCVAAFISGISVGTGVYASKIYGFTLQGFGFFWIYNAGVIATFLFAVWVTAITKHKIRKAYRLRKVFKRCKESGEQKLYVEITDWDAENFDL